MFKILNKTNSTQICNFYSSDHNENVLVNN